ncbi:MAG: T9SS type A sorting domain-containing protein [Bacteroidales bacterium]|nr:T9SS type A sorting domain-containing protein [Bacteroidales bacterium]
MRPKNSSFTSLKIIAMPGLQIRILVGLIALSQLTIAGDHNQYLQGYYEARFTVTIPVIDGNGNDTCWNKADWAPIDQVWIGNAVSETDYSGRFKVLWASDRIYLLIQIVDDSLHIQPTGIADVCSNIYNYDCTEIFIDENHSRDANYTGTYKAIAYHMDTTHVCYYIGGAPGWVRLDDHLKYKMQRVAPHTFEYEYELKVFDDTYVDGSVNTPVQLTNEKLLGWSVAYNDNDLGSTRQNMFGSKLIEEADKNISYYNASAFGELKLVGNYVTSVISQELWVPSDLSVRSDEGKLQVTYSSDHIKAAVVIQLFDVFGRQLFSVTENKSESKLEKDFNVSHLSKGIYIVRVTEGAISNNEKIYLW